MALLCLYFTISHHFKPTTEVYIQTPPKNYNAENEGFLKLSTIHEKT